MTKCKITVLERMFNRDLAEKYRTDNPKPCELFCEGQEFIIENWERPKDFCDWAWNDIYKVYVALMSGSTFEEWMKNKRSMIACCTDGVRPVVFKIEMMEG